MYSKFSLRACFAAILVLSCLLTYHRRQLDLYIRESRAISVIQGKGGTIEYAKDGSVSAINCPNADDDLCNYFSQFDGLESLILRHSTITDAGLHVIFNSNRRLKKLSIASAHVTDDGISKISRLTDSLSFLSFRCNKVTDRGMEYISTLNLEFLSIGSTLVTDDGLSLLPKMKTLEELEIWEVNATDACLPIVIKCPNLRHLYLYPRFSPEQVDKIRANSNVLIPSGLREY